MSVTSALGPVASRRLPSSVLLSLTHLLFFPLLEHIYCRSTRTKMAWRSTHSGHSSTPYSCRPSYRPNFSSQMPTPR
ncbi:hypothetical protein BJV77DRAFT_1006186 [Russula vinacea]|nr:hypothetical protein BJV77DRAFT_1037969 [Russula vinacea]KAH9991689.1 hypothetical protein BJV77DRAFT_1006186 [Russula vinacea]